MVQVIRLSGPFPIGDSIASRTTWFQVGVLLPAVHSEIEILLWKPILLSNFCFKRFLIKAKLWKFIISWYNLCSEIYPFQLIINFCNFALIKKYLNKSYSEGLTFIIKNKFQSDWIKIKINICRLSTLIYQTRHFSECKIFNKS